MSNVLQFKKPGIFARAHLQWTGFIGWLKFKFHNHYWIDLTSDKIMSRQYGTKEQSHTGYVYFQKCTVPGCGQRRVIKSEL